VERGRTDAADHPFRAPERPVSDEKSTITASRREFLRKGAIAAVALPAASSILGACAGETKAEPPKAAAASADPHAAGHAAPAAGKSVAEKAAEMDAMHEKGVKAFPAKTAKWGNLPMAPKMDGKVKVFELTCTKIKWETEPGKFVDAMAYNDQVPGPQIRVTEGDRVRFVVTNRMEESTAVHFHGLEVPNDQDGVPFITQPPIRPGETFTYEFEVPNAGSHMYHSHHNAGVQTTMGLLGAIVVEPKRPKAWEKVDVDYVMILNDGSHGFTLNGKSFPATEPIVVKQGQRVRIRYMNEGYQIHPMHLHGMHMTVVAKDGWEQPMHWKCDTLNIAPGERWDVIVEATNPGVWAFHCHILSHAESPHGMFGMVTAMIVEKKTFA
jgi:FtsP/CotA-like multicopper oxidase with cupredoxin domain